jgi:hypothetical protein
MMDCEESVTGNTASIGLGFERNTTAFKPCDRLARAETGEGTDECSPTARIAER